MSQIHSPLGSFASRIAAGNNIIIPTPETANSFFEIILKQMNIANGMVDGFG